MKTKLSLLFILFISLSFGQFTSSWQSCFGGTDADKGSDVINTSDGNVLWVGHSKSLDGNLSVNLGNYDALVVKTDGNGSILWQTSFGGSNVDYLYKAAEDNGNYIVVGASKSDDNDITGNHGNYDVLVAKLDGNGTLQWTKSLGGSDLEKASSVLVTSDGGYLISGYSKSSDGDLTANAGNYDVWIVKLDASGNILWQKNMGGSGDDRSSGLMATTDGNFIFSGYSKSNNGDVTSNQGNYDYWVVKFDNTGTILWSKSFGGSGIDKDCYVAELVLGDYIIAGYSMSADGDITSAYGSFDYWVIKIDGNGNMIWQKSFGGSDADFVTGIVSKYQLNADTIYISGYSNSDNHDFDVNYGSYDAWIISIDENGTLLNKKRFGGTDTDRFTGISQNDFFLVGTTKSNDNDITGQHGNYDFLMTRFSTASSGIDSQNTNLVKLFPNPANNLVNIQAVNIQNIQIIDMQGKKLMEKNYPNIELVKLNVENLPKGVYHLHILTHTGQVIKRLVK